MNNQNFNLFETYQNEVRLFYIRDQWTKKYLFHIPSTVIFIHTLFELIWAQRLIAI